MVPVVDAGVLRKALRLIHCLQKERGASCAHQIVTPQSREHASSVPPSPPNTKNQNVHNRNAPHQHLHPARRDTDRAFAMLLHNHRYQTPMDTDLPIERVTLDKIRKLVHVVEPAAASANIQRNNDPIHQQGQQQQQYLNPTSNHQLLKSYNTLIQSLAHEYVLRHTTVAKHRCDLQRRRQQQQKFSQQQHQQQQPQQIWLRHSQSHQALQQMANSTNTTPPSSTKQQKHKRTSSSGVVLLKPSSDPTQSWQQQRSSSPPNTITDTTAFPKVDSGISFHDDGGCFDNNVDDYHRHQGEEGQEDGVRIEDTIEGDSDDKDNQHNDNATAGHEVLVPITDKTETSCYNQNNTGCETVDENSNDEERVLRLLQLLDVFVRLKESTGVERATLASILVASDRDDDRGSRLMVADLVMEVENQRRQVASLHELLQQQPEPPNLLIAQELVSMSPQMKQLQDTILLQGFDLDSLKRSFEQGGGASGAGGLWNLLTLYIDKLHSLELLIVEEIECCVGIRAGQGDAPLVIDYSNSSMMVVGEHSNNSNGESSSHHIVETSSSNNNSKPGPVVCHGEVFGLSSGYTNEELRERIESLAPEEIKRCLLEAASSAATASTKPAESHVADESNSQNDAAEAAAGRRVEDLLAELSKAPASKEWEIDLYEIRFLKRIGQGNAGTTYLADWKGLNVAVKVASITEMGLDGWRTEVQNLQRLHHPNVIRLLGSVYHPSPLTFCLVLEYCNGGELADALQRVTPPSFFFRVADGLAKGMAYLHSRGVIHRDIKPSNTLLDGNVATGQFAVKVTDFGLATEASLSGDRTAETGTYRWMAPEVIRHEDYSQTADVYSFAVVLWQLVTRDEPFHHQSQVEAAAAVALENARPPFPENTPPAIAKLIQTCWSREPNERLSFDEIVEELQEMEKVLDPEEKEWIEAPLGHTVYRRRTTMMAELEIPERTLNVPSAAAGEKKKPKGFRTLFNRKSTHF